jgi:hypothetical protein
MAFESGAQFQVKNRRSIGPVDGQGSLEGCNGLIPTPVLKG